MNLPLLNAEKAAEKGERSGGVDRGILPWFTSQSSGGLPEPHLRTLGPRVHRQQEKEPRRQKVSLSGFVCMAVRTAKT